MCFYGTITPVFDSQVQIDDDALSLADFLHLAAMIIKLAVAHNDLGLSNAKQLVKQESEFGQP